MIYRRKDLLGLRDLSKEEIFYFLDHAKYFKELNKQTIKKTDSLRGQTVINAFYENSTRTRISFETAGKRLSGDVINFTPSLSSAKKGETLVDTIRNIEAMQTNIFVMRHLHSGAADFISKRVDASIINAGDGLNEHPTQGLLDLFTIREHKGKFEGLTVAMVGDIAHSRVARSDIWAMKKLGINIKLFGPSLMLPRNLEIFGCHMCKTMEEALEGTDVVIMLRIQLERQDGAVAFPSMREYSKFFGLNKQRVSLANKNLLVFHPGPINRGVELNSDVADSECSYILNQVENGVAVRMAVLDTFSRRG